MSELKTNRGWFKFYFLTFITLGIYALFFYHRLAKDLNKVCEEDGRKTAGLLKYILFSLITCGIYSIIWTWKAANRIRDYGERHNVEVKTSGVSWFLWTLIGSLLCGLGPIIAWAKFLKSMNIICRDAQAREQAAKVQAELDAKRAEEEARRAEEEARHAEEQAKLEAKREEERAAREAAQAAAQAAAIAEAVARAMASVNGGNNNAAPAQEAPAAEEVPAAEEAPVEEATAEEAPAEEAPMADDAE